RRYTQNLRLELASRDPHRGILRYDQISGRRFGGERRDSERCDDGKRTPGFGVAITHQKEPLRCIQVSSKKAKPRAAGLRPVERQRFRRSGSRWLAEVDRQIACRSDRTTLLIVLVSVLDIQIIRNAGLHHEFASLLTTADLQTI